MSSALTAIIIVALLVMGCIQIARMANRSKLDERGMDATDQRIARRNAELEDEVGQLRERVKVLEKIATDPARRTADEIEKLRD